MIKEIKADVLKAPVKHPTIIVHQTNCRGAMGAGIAASIRRSYPEVYEQYRKITPDPNLLGTVQVVRVSDKLCIANLFGQKEYGTNKRQTDYDAFKHALTNLRDYITDGTVVRFPYGIGCGLAGGDWNIVSKLIETTLKDKDVEIYRLR